MTVPPARQSAFQNAPLIDLLDILLRQFKRPLAAVDVDLSAQDSEQIASEIAARSPLSPKALEVRDGLIRVVEQSEALLAGWGLTFEESLRKTMDAMPNWETTAEFLEVANEKTNAELRIAGGSALLLALGEPRFRQHLTFLVKNPSLDDVSAIMAQRILDFVDEKQA